jgi:hypothetical protein
MPIPRFAGQLLRALPFLGDIYNTSLEYRDQREAGFSPARALARSIPVGATGMLTNVVDPFGVSNVAPEVLRGIAARERKVNPEGKPNKVWGEPITRGTDPRVLSGFAPSMAMGQFWQSPEALEAAAKVADYINSEAHARSIVDRVDPQTRGTNYSLDVNERFEQLRRRLGQQ